MADDPRDLTLAEITALRDRHGDADVLNALVDVEVPEGIVLSDASQELAAFLTLFLRRIDRRGEFIRHAVKIALTQALDDYVNLAVGDLPPAS